MKKSQAETIFDTALRVRNELIAKYHTDDMTGKDSEASEMLVKALATQGYKSKVCFGYCLYDNGEYSDSVHNYVLVAIGRDSVYLDITATQYRKYIREDIPDIIMLMPGSNPYWLRSKKN